MNTAPDTTPPKEFTTAILGSFLRPTPEEQRLRELAREYHDRTEAYDRTVCTGPILRNGIMPATDRERSLITQNADMLRAALDQEAAGLGFTWPQWLRAIRNAEPMMPDAHPRTEH